MSDEELNRALSLFRQSGHAWSEHWMRQPAPPPKPDRPWALAPALASALVIAAILLSPPAPKPVATAQPFVPIPFVAPPAPYERIAITRMELPVAALIAAGFDVSAADPGGTVQADVLTGQDGRAHAIRLLRRSIN